MIIGACLLLISGCITSSDDGHRFAACKTVVSASEKVVYVYQDGDKIKKETETLLQERVFTEDELNTIRELTGGEECVFDYTFPVCAQKAAQRQNCSLYGHIYSAVKLTGFSLAECKAPQKDEIVIDENFASEYGVNIGDTLEIQMHSEKRRQKRLQADKYSPSL